MSRLTVFNPKAARAKLNAGLAETSIRISETQGEQLIAYLGLMAKWNHIYNLSAIRDTDKMISHHLLDSLVVLPILEQWLHASNPNQNNPSILDVGTGGGLPPSRGGSLDCPRTVPAPRSLIAGFRRDFIRDLLKKLRKNILSSRFLPGFYGIIVLLVIILT